MWNRTSPGCYQRGGACVRTKAGILIKSGLHNRRWRRAIVDILNTVDRGTEKHIMESLEIEQPELADEIRKKMFVFEGYPSSRRPCDPACVA